MRLIHRILAFPLFAGFLLCCSCNHGTSQLGADFAQDNRYARGFSISEGEGFTMVQLRNPWDTATLRACYLLIPENQEVPEHLPKGEIIRTPLRDVAVVTALYLSVMEELGCLDATGGVCEPEYVTSRAAREMLTSGQLADLGNSVAPNCEKIIECGAQAILASPFENAGFGALEKLGIPIIEAADYMENTPLGRCEWIRFYGRLFGCGEAADSLFDAAAGRYEELKRLTDTLQERPKVLLEKRYGSSWFIPAGNSFAAAFHKDAGADYIFAEHTGDNNTPLSSEKVYELGQNADFWFFKYAADENCTRAQLIGEYPLYSGIKAFAEGKAYGCNTIRTDYYNDVTLHPERLLEELIRIYHPQLLPEGELKYYEKLP